VSRAVSWTRVRRHSLTLRDTQCRSQLPVTLRFRGESESKMAFLNPLAPGSSPGWPTRNGTSLPIRRTMRPRSLWCLLTHRSALRGLLSTETTSHDASKPICHFWPWWLAPCDLSFLALASRRPHDFTTPRVPVAIQPREDSWLCALLAKVTALIAEVRIFSEEGSAQWAEVSQFRTRFRRVSETEKLQPVPKLFLRTRRP